MASTEHTKTRSQFAVETVLEPNVNDLPSIVDLGRYPIHDTGTDTGLHLRATCVRRFREDGLCILPNFLRSEAVQFILSELVEHTHNVYVSATLSTVYLRPGDRSFPSDHPMHAEQLTRLGTLANDQFFPQSMLRRLYESTIFRRFLAGVIGVPRLHNYADPLTSLNVLVSQDGDQLGWHFDEADYAITILLQAPQGGGQFEYVPAIRSSKDENYEEIGLILNGRSDRVRSVEMLPGTLLLFRGRHSLHRVTETHGDVPRLVAVLSYDAQPGRKLSEHDRRLFYGRVD